MLSTTLPSEETGLVLLAGLSSHLFRLLNSACVVAIFVPAVDRAQQDQKPVTHRPVCHIPSVREECVALQLCAKCGAISHGRLDWFESDGVDGEALAAVEAAVAKAAADFGGVEEDTVASGGEIIEGQGAKSDDTEDAILHTIFDRILRGGGGGDLRPGTGSQRFFCMKCWRWVTFSVYPACRSQHCACTRREGGRPDAGCSYRQPII
jgi:hypothetical protein